MLSQAMRKTPGRVAAAPADRTVVSWAALPLLLMLPSMPPLQAAVKPAAVLETLMAAGVCMAHQGLWPA